MVLFVESRSEQLLGKSRIITESTRDDLPFRADLRSMESPRVTCIESDWKAFVQWSWFSGGGEILEGDGLFGEKRDVDESVDLLVVGLLLEKIGWNSCLHLDDRSGKDGLNGNGQGQFGEMKAFVEGFHLGEQFLTDHGFQIIESIVIEQVHDREKSLSSSLIELCSIELGIKPVPKEFQFVVDSKFAE